MQAFHVSMEETVVALAVTTHVGVPVALTVQPVKKVARNSYLLVYYHKAFLIKLNLTAHSYLRLLLNCRRAVEWFSFEC